MISTSSTEPPGSTPDDARAELLRKSNRRAVPLRKTFVQTPRELAQDPDDLSGPLAEFVRSGDHRGLLAYLLIVASISSELDGEGWSLTLPTAVWARALGTIETAGRPSAVQAVSKIHKRLEDRKLVERHRTGRERKVRVTLLEENGSGSPYTRPTGKSRSERFLQLPHEFWLDGWDRKLKLPGLAMVLGALHESGPNRPSFQLAAEQVPRWYGWSADTTERGLDELRRADLLHAVWRRRKEPLSVQGVGRVNDYYLAVPFGPSSPADIANARLLYEGTFIDAPSPLRATAETGTATVASP